jgi:segregation and condensation protein A
VAPQHGPPQQQEIPFAVVRGEPQFELPKDLFIPPDALEVILDAFEGPLDLLLYLIRRQNLDILDIPIADITAQYMEYIQVMKDLRLELAAEYLVMAAMLAEIKSRMLLPRPVEDSDEEEDPRAELVRRLQEYERFKQAAEDLDALPQLGRELFAAVIEFPHRDLERPLPELELHELLHAMQDVLQRADLFTKHQITREPLSMRERMSRVLEAVHDGHFVEFTSLFALHEGRRGVVVTFLAILELLKQGLVETVQAEAFGPIYVQAGGGSGA